jgi:ABC-type branched-subunit amino acid transport system permease subunit
MASRTLLPSVAAVFVGIAAVVLLPRVVELYTLINATIYLSMALFALSMAFIWGHGGILCFGQAAFFGLGAYAYAVTAINLGDSTLAIVAAAVAPTIFAAILGYFLFFGRLTDVYFGVITLTVTLILFKLANSTAGEAYRIGNAKLGGFNGMPDTPPLNFPFIPSWILSPEQAFAATVLALVTAYVLCKWIIGTRFGRAVAAVRENEMRAELLGYDSRMLKLATFMIGAAIAGVAGMLFATSVFVSPTVFSLATAAQVLIWVVVGGLGTLAGPIIASILLQILAAFLGTLGWIDPNVVLGAVLIGFVLVAPRGLMPLVFDGYKMFAVRSPAGAKHAVAKGLGRG